MKIIFNSSYLVISVALQSCGADGNHPGYEYMPNMYRSPSTTHILKIYFRKWYHITKPVKGPFLEVLCHLNMKIRLRII